MSEKLVTVNKTILKPTTEVFSFSFNTDRSSSTNPGRYSNACLLGSQLPWDLEPTALGSPAKQSECFLVVGPGK